jgi:hypothetical protein
VPRETIPCPRPNCDGLATVEVSRLSTPTPMAGKLSGACRSGASAVPSARTLERHSTASR